MEKHKLSGYLMAIVGFILILFNAANYIFGWGVDTPFGVIGLVLVAVGMGTVKKYRK